MVGCVVNITDWVSLAKLVSWAVLAYFTGPHLLFKWWPRLSYFFLSSLCKLILPHFLSLHFVIYFLFVPIPLLPLSLFLSLSGSLSLSVPLSLCLYLSFSLSVSLSFSVPLSHSNLLYIKVSKQCLSHKRNSFSMMENISWIVLSVSLGQLAVCLRWEPTPSSSWSCTPIKTSTGGAESWAASRSRHCPDPTPVSSNC